MEYNIIFRSCDKVNAFSGGGKTRPFGTKFEVISKCFKSLVRSIKHYKTSDLGQKNPVNLFICDDHSSEDLLEMIRDTASKYDVEYRMIPMTETGNGNSLKACYEYAYQNLDGFLFFIEDDYLMVESAIEECFEAYLRFKEITKNDVVIHPADYPDRYDSRYGPIEPAFVLLGRDRHWRTIAHTTCTFGISKKILIEHWDKYEGITKYGIDPTINEENTINMVYKQYLCFSPIPSLAHHYQFEHTLSPFLELGR